MSTLFPQILLCLLLAFLIGLLVGCLICRISGRRCVQVLESEIADLRAKLRACENKVRQGTDAGKFESSLDSCRKENTDLRLRLVDLESRRSEMDVRGLQIQNFADTAPVAAGLLEMDEPSVPDNLTRIWGIGKKMQELLNGGGILTFVKLANTPVAELRELIEAYGSARLSRLANEESWPKQAALAARGEWDELDAYQEKPSWAKGGVQGATF